MLSLQGLDDGRCARVRGDRWIERPRRIELRTNRARGGACEERDDDREDADVARGELWRSPCRLDGLRDHGFPAGVTGAAAFPGPAALRVNFHPRCAISASAFAFCCDRIAGVGAPGVGVGVLAVTT